MNTAISAIMELVNIASSLQGESKNIHPAVMRSSLETVLLLLFPMVPHFCEEMWETTGHTTSLDHVQWPEFDKEELFTRAFEVYSTLGKWISWETTKEDVAKQYKAHGIQRRQQKFDLAEVVQALIRMRIHLFLKVFSEGLLDTAYELNQAIGLYVQVVRYFDRAIYFTIIGYMDEGKA